MSKAYRTNTSNSSTTLKSLYERLRTIEEAQTCVAVQHCVELIEQETEKWIISCQGDFPKIFSQQETMIHSLQRIIGEVYYKRFNIKLTQDLTRIDTHALQELQFIIEHWHQTKRTTINLTRLIELISEEAWQNKGSQITTGVILKKLGINSSQETEELNIGLNKRLEGGMLSVKQYFIQQFNARIADIFYKTHDQVIDLRILDIISELGVQMALEQGRWTAVLDA